MKIMDIDCGMFETTVVIKDDIKGSIKRKVYSHKELTHRELLDLLYYRFVGQLMDEVHIETNGYGMLAYDYFMGTDASDKIKAFKYEQFSH